MKKEKEKTQFNHDAKWSWSRSRIYRFFGYDCKLPRLNSL